MAVSPYDASGYLVRYKITSGGSAIDESIRVVSVRVQSAINRIPMAEIVVLDGDMPTQTFPVSDGSTFKPGAEISIEAGYDDTTELIFQGIVIRQGLKITGDNDARLLIECRDKAVKMTVGRKNANYVDKKDSDIITSLVGTYGLSSDISATDTQHKEIVQHYSTDWDFVLARAELNGMLVLADQNKITVQAPDTGSPAALRVEYGGDLIEFQADVDSRNQFSEVKAVTWDPAQQQIVEQTSGPETLNSQGDLTSSTLAQVIGLASFRIQSPAPMQTSELKSWAKGQQVKSGLARIRGRMKFQGSALARIGTLLTVAGVGTRFNGDVFVSAVNHEVVDGNWTTEVEFGLSPQWFVDQRDLITPPAAGRLPGIEGLHVGVIKKLDADPESENRVQVSIPLLAAQTDGVWARLSNFYASDQFGDFFIPEIGDEVVLGYLNDDPSSPVILGSLYSSKRKPPYDLTAENNTKAIVTRTKLRLIFDEDKKSITAITPALNKIVIDDDDKSILVQDQTGNKIKLSTSGILIDSPKDITVNAQGKITMTAMNNISVTSQADVSVAGLNIKQTANIGFVAKGNATAELSASGQTTVRGGMVMIN